MPVRDLVLAIVNKKAPPKRGFPFHLADALPQNLKPTPTSTSFDEKPNFVFGVVANLLVP